MNIARIVTRLPVVQDFPALQRDRIAATGQVIDLRAGDEVWERGEGASVFNFVVEGRIRLTVPQGKQQEFLVDVVESPGALVCVPAVCGAAQYCCRAVCTSKSKLLTVPREEFLQDISPIGVLLLNQASVRAVKLCRRLREVGGMKVQCRVVAVLLRLADEHGGAGRGQARIPASVSRRELAGLSGCATETLIRVLAQLEREGVVSRSDRGLLVNIGLLSDRAYAGALDP